MSKRIGLTAKELKFIAAFVDNAKAAARVAGFESASAASRLMQKPAIREAIRQKKQVITSQVEKKAGNLIAHAITEQVTIGRNGIINGLARIAQDEKMSDSARVSAFAHLAEIFDIKGRRGKDEDFFRGWTEEELLEYAQTGKLPERIFGTPVKVMKPN